MEILIIWIGTIIASFQMQMCTVSKMLKDIADNGYKIDIKKATELSNQLNPDAAKINLISFLIPIYNIVSVLERGMLYNNVRNTIIDRLKVIDCLASMSKEEEEEYKKKPTALNAIQIMIREQPQFPSRSISYTENNEKNTIWFREENGEFIFVKSEGSVSKLSDIEQRAILIEKMNDFNTDLNIRDSLKYLEDRKEQKDIHIDLDEVKENNKNSEPLTTEEYIKLLESLRDDLMKYKPTPKNSQETKGFQKTKKRK